MSGGALHLLLSYPRKWINSNKKQNISGAGLVVLCSLFVCTTIIDQVLQLFSPARLGYIIASDWKINNKVTRSQINVSMSVKPGRFVNL